MNSSTAQQRKSADLAELPDDILYVITNIIIEDDRVVEIAGLRKSTIISNTTSTICTGIPVSLLSRGHVAGFAMQS